MSYYPKTSLKLKGVRFVDGWGQVILTNRPANTPNSVIVLAENDVYLAVGREHLKLKP